MTGTVAASSPTPSDTLRAAAPDLARRLGLTLGGLCTAIGFSLRGADPAGKALGELAWKRVFHMRHVLEALLTRIAAGWLPRPRPARTIARTVGCGAAGTAPPAPTSDAPPPPPDAPPRVHVGPPPVAPWPRRHACLVQVVGYHAAGFGSQLNHLLTDPAMAELVATVPSVGRMLRPLCRVLGISPPVLGFPPPPPPRQVKPARQPRGAPSAISLIYAALAMEPVPAPEPVPGRWEVRRRWVLPGSA
jgi:hypothetical protein